MKNAMRLLVFGMFLFLVGIVSADVNFVGTVYKDADPIVGLGGVDIIVTCGGVDSDSVKSLDNGAYGVGFVGNCSDGDILIYTLSLSSYKETSRGSIGSYSGMYNSTYEIALSSGDFLYITDFILVKRDAPVVNRRSGGSTCDDRVWDCGTVWSTCIGNFQNRACMSNCGREKIEVQACEVEEEQSEIVLSDEDPLISGESEPGAVQTFFSAMTGAVVGGGAVAWGAAGAFIVLAIGSFGVVRFRKNRRLRRR